MGRWVFLFGAPAVLGALATGCDGSDDGDTSVDASTRDGATGAACAPRDDAPEPDPSACGPRDGDWAPCSDDGYGACVSDDGEYHGIEQTISTIGRVAAFEEIAALLFRPDADPSRQDFIDAQLIYLEPEGLDSRVVRRYDPHFEVPDGTDCALEGVPEDEPDYCVGPGILQPILTDAFTRGIAQETPRAQAGRIEAALLWFLYASTSKESLTCTDTAKDCDSAYAYYTGGEPARDGLGLARYVQEADAYAHDRAWDGVLAVRCWRDLDSAPTATDLTRRDRARGQLDRALLDGLAAILAARLAAIAASDGDTRAHHAAFVRTLAPALDREARSRDAGEADALAAALAGTDPADVDTAAAIEALDTLFDCP